MAPAILSLVLLSRHGRNRLEDPTVYQTRLSSLRDTGRPVDIQMRMRQSSQYTSLDPDGDALRAFLIVSIMDIHERGAAESDGAKPSFVLLVMSTASTML